MQTVRAPTGGNNQSGSAPSCEINIQPIAKIEITAKISWHTFRHTFSSILKQSGRHIKVVQELMRHASSTMMLDI